MSEHDGFEKPNHTQTPNSFFDTLLPQLTSSAEIKITLTLIRETFGWHRPEVELSFADFEQKAGLTRQGVANGLKLCLKRGTITRRKVGQGFIYRLRLSEPVNEIDQSTKLTSQRNRPQVVNKVDRKVVNEIDRYIDKEKEERKIKENAANAGAQTRKKPDERSQHPAIQAIRSLMNRYPDKVWYDDIIEVLGTDFDVGKLKGCRKEWTGRGWNSNGLEWVYWYRDGIPERNGNGTGKSDAAKNRGQNSRQANSAGRDVSERAAYDPWEDKPVI